MHVEQKKFDLADGWVDVSSARLGDSAQLVLVFGERTLLENDEHLVPLREQYPKAYIVGCSTSGEVLDTEVCDDTIIATALHFEHTSLQVSKTKVDAIEDSFDAGVRVGEGLEKKDLKHVILLSEGLHVNGTELIRGITSALPDEVVVTGGLSGDKDRFEKTVVCSDGVCKPDDIVAVGFYGDRLRIGYGSMGGWDPFGPVRRVTRSVNNILYELDGKPALDLYKTYLGDQAAGLPATGLLFPLSLYKEDGAEKLVRTVLEVNEADKSMRFAGDIPEGSDVQLMRANFDRLVDGASDAASMTHEPIGDMTPDFALVISCVGRKLILRQRIEEEVEAAKEKLGPQTTLAGFYSYGEICPVKPTQTHCELHNQTMTITTFTEVSE